MSVSGSFKELSEWMGYKKRETTKRSKIIRRQMKRENEQVAYFNFKKVAFKKIDEILYTGENSVVYLRPKEGKERLFVALTEDEDFRKYYKGRITSGGELEVSMRQL